MICYRLAALVLVITNVGCSREHGEVREWRATDHDQEAEEPASKAAGTALGIANESGDSAAVRPSNAADPRTSWNSLCAGCHGQLGSDNRIGRPEMGVRDLTDPSWQQSVSDLDIATTITTGRGRMPPFRLPREQVAAFIKLIRSLKQQK